MNPYDDNGLVDLSEYPLLEKYLTQFKRDLEKRHVAKKNPEQWFKTIDRIFVDRARQPKFLIPDIKGAFTVVPENGNLYANNSLYFILLQDWPINALQAILSVIGPFFIEAYSTKVMGENLRFQAQHLRRIRIPAWQDIGREMRARLETATLSDQQELSDMAKEIYSLTKSELSSLTS